MEKVSHRYRSIGSRPANFRSKIEPKRSRVTSLVIVGNSKESSTNSSSKSETRESDDGKESDLKDKDKEKERKQSVSFPPSNTTDSVRLKSRELLASALRQGKSKINSIVWICFISVLIQRSHLCLNFSRRRFGRISITWRTCRWIRRRHFRWIEKYRLQI